MACSHELQSKLTVQPYSESWYSDAYGGAECGMRGVMVTGRQPDPGGRPLPHPAQQVAPLAALLQAAALVAAAAQAQVEATPALHPAVVVEASYIAGSM